MGSVLLLNYSHPIDGQQREHLSTMLGTEVEVRNIPVQVDQRAPLEPQIIALADAAMLSIEQWQITAILINPPGLAIAAVLLLAEIHGRSGHFPATVHIRPKTGPIAGYEIGGLINVQELRERARGRRRNRDDQ